MSKLTNLGRMFNLGRRRAPEVVSKARPAAPTPASRFSQAQINTQAQRQFTSARPQAFPRASAPQQPAQRAYQQPAQRPAQRPSSRASTTSTAEPPIRFNFRDPEADSERPVIQEVGALRKNKYGHSPINYSPVRLKPVIVENGVEVEIANAQEAEVELLEEPEFVNQVESKKPEKDGTIKRSRAVRGSRKYGESRHGRTNSLNVKKDDNDASGRNRSSSAPLVIETLDLSPRRGSGTGAVAETSGATRTRTRELQGSGPTMRAIRDFESRARNDTSTSASNGNRTRAHAADSAVPRSRNSSTGANPSLNANANATVTEARREPSAWLRRREHIVRNYRPERYELTREQADRIRWE